MFLSDRDNALMLQLQQPHSEIVPYQVHLSHAITTTKMT